MAVTRLNPSARPFHCTRHHVFLAPPPPLPLYHAAGAAPPPFPFVATYSSCTPFPFQYYPHCGGYPVMRMAAAPAPFSKGLLAASPAAPPPPPHGCPPHKLMLYKGGAPTVTDEKLHAQAQAAARAAWRRPAPATVATVAAPPRRMLVAAAAPCRMLRHPAAARVARRGVSREYRPGKKQQQQQQRGGERERSPPPAFTTGPMSPLPLMQKLKPTQTTVMVRNIPNKLTRMDMVRLLDDHCARENRRRGGGGAARVAYDLVYVRMDFGMCNEQRCSNMGYAFVNFTTAEAARGLQRALHGCRWKRPAFDSSKIIDIRAARIQGKEALVRHFGRTTYFKCVTDEYLPAVFSPPRDGSAAAAPSPADGEVKTVGNRVPPRQITLLTRRN